MSTRTESLVGKLSIQDTEWKAGLARAARQFRTFATQAGKTLASGISSGFGALKGLGSMLGKIGGQVAGVLSVLGGVGSALSLAGIAAGMKGAVDLGGELSDVSARTGIAVDQLVILREQFRQGGIEAGRVTDVVVRMNRALLDGKKEPLFKSLGLDQSRLLTMKTADAMNAVIGRVRKIKGLAKQQEALGGIFGKSAGPEMMTLVVDTNSFENAKKMVGGMAADMKEFANDFDFISDMVSGISVKMQQLFTSFTGQLREPLLEFANTILEMDLSPVGKRLGAQLMWAGKLFQSLWKQGTFWDYAKMGIANLVMWGISYAVGAVKVMWGAIFDEKNFLVIKTFIDAIGMYFGGVMNEVVAEMRANMPGGGLYKLSGGFGEAMAGAAVKKQAAGDMAANAVGFAGDLVPHAMGKIVDGLANIQPLDMLKPWIERNTAAMDRIAWQATDSARIARNSPIQSLSDLSPFSKIPKRTWTLPGGQTVETERLLPSNPTERRPEDAAATGPQEITGPELSRMVEILSALERKMDPVQ
jgi:hypothetical protein